jgi:hypothetical protein
LVLLLQMQQKNLQLKQKHAQHVVKILNKGV